MGVLAKVTVIDRIEVVEDGTIQLRFATYVSEDGKRLTDPLYHRTAYNPGDEIPDTVKVVNDETPVPISDRVKSIAATVWTPQVISASRASRRTQAVVQPAMIRPPE